MRCTRPFERTWGHWHPDIAVTGNGDYVRGGAVSLPARFFAADDSGPNYKGMDPSDPLTWVRPWNPGPGMIQYLNFDGAAMQGRTPTGGLQRGSQARGKRGTK